ncbi:LamG-like jellyroll fold domain-containing protein [Haloferax sp. ATB1]|uniref:LamG-like jellyroll fold domain-containing protein n=1 Tax=Haloferax sp. ATB1 TaxID=1508454 RepID=UPI0005B22BBC|nr:LamG-like jellyroll fold domain-containing protein [Haloferax sp. ATB1]
MSQLNLQDGLEAWYTFDDVDYDGGRNVVRDRSGNGRHLALNGGVSMGKPSPVGEAASFDGTDDYGVIGTDPIFYDQTEFSMFAVVRADSFTTSSGSVNSIFAFGGGANARQYQLSVDDDGSGSPQLEFKITSGSDSHILSNDNLELGQFVSVVATYDDGEMLFDVSSGGQRKVTTDTSPISLETTPRQFFVGALDGAYDFWNGLMSLAGHSSRVVSEQERDYIHDMTARRVSLL